MSKQRIPGRGDVYESMGCRCRVLRVSLLPSVKYPHGWADLSVQHLGSGVRWRKRQPLPFAESFTFLHAVGDEP